MKKRLLAVCLSIVMLVTMMSVMPLTTSALAKGDINNDGRVDTLDVRLIMRGALGADAVTQNMIFVGDMNPDNALTTADAQVLMRQVLLSDTAEVQDLAYAYPADTDCWGERAIALIGDSISFGAGAADPLPENSYVSYIKKAVQKANGGNMNYGFTSAYPTAWGNVSGGHDYTATEIHAWPTYDSAAWDDSDNGEYLYSIAYTSSTVWSTLTYTLRNDYPSEYAYACVYYQAQPGGGNFALADGNGGQVADVTGNDQYIPTANTTSVTKRSAFFKLADCPKDANGAPQIIICHGSTAGPVTITGIGYYKNLSPSTPTFNAYVRGGSSLTGMSDQVLTQAASADTLIMAMGYNDVYFYANKVNSGEFAQKIDHLIEVCNENNTKVIVSKHIWDNTSVVGRNTAQEQAYQTATKELQRLAKETGGIYIDQQGIYGDQMLATLNGTYANGDTCDGVHPNSAGHILIAKNIVAAMGLTWADDWT